jgi:histidine triad (HIT) family protein
LSYDPNNVFARILRGELPCRKVYEDELSILTSAYAGREPGTINE